MHKERPAFNQTELDVIGGHPCGALEMFKHMGFPPMPPVEPLFNRPITCKENYKLAVSGEKPYWTPTSGWAYCDVNVYRPRIFPDNVASRIVYDGQEPIEYSDGYEMKGWFDLTWVFVPAAGGATVKPGSPLIEDMNDWEKLIKWPDLDALDWESTAKKDAKYLDTPQMNQLCLLNGFWERLMSLMDVSGAAIALIDEDQTDAVKAFFDKYADFLVDCIGRMKKACPQIDGVLIHDDWGHQNGSFFSLDTVMEMIVPYLRRVTDYVHSQGMIFELHSCGKGQSLVPAYIASGVDVWCPQSINDFDMLTEKYKNEPIWFGAQDVGVPQDTPDEVAAAAAHEWFEKHKDQHAMLALSAANPVFMGEIYRLSREYYSK